VEEWRRGGGVERWRSREVEEERGGGEVETSALQGSIKMG